MVEVRFLRQALQTLPRMSIDTSDREDVRRLTASLNETRDTLIKTPRTIPQFIDRQKMLESRIQLDVDQSKRADLELN